MAAIRAFLAIPLPSACKNQIVLAQKKLAAEVANVRWVAPGSVHLTLKFFADLHEESLEKIGQIMLSVGALFPPFPIHIGGLGTFPTPLRARVFWLGIQGGERLNQLHAELEQNLEQIGIPRENRPFTPHLTLGRHRQGIFVPGPVLHRHGLLHCDSFLAEQVILYQSRLGPAGATHIPLHTLSLTGPTPNRVDPEKD